MQIRKTDLWHVGCRGFIILAPGFGGEMGGRLSDGPKSFAATIGRFAFDKPE